MRLPRPYVPLAIRVAVIERQLLEVGIPPPIASGSLSVRLYEMLWERFGAIKVELHHRPALVNRRRKRNGDYDPPANHPDYLIYLPKAEHIIETRVRGIGAQLSDLGQARKRKRKERKATRRKTRWAKRPLRSKSNWPKRAMR